MTIAATSSARDTEMNPKQDFPVVVTVTYGNRKHLLLQMIDGCQSQGVVRFVVVNNGAKWDVGELKREYPGLTVDIVDMEGNKGSAPGYAAGIQGAVDIGAEFIWLMDDDNCPRKGALSTLIDAYKKELSETPRDRIAVVGFRPESQTDEGLRLAEWRINPRDDSFCGFHVFDIPRKIERYLPFGKSRLRHSLPARIAIQESPYSSLLFHRSLIKSIGLPNPNFVLYGDDFDFTYRITRIGGRILLITTALIDDLESFWFSRKRYGNGLSGMLCGGEDYRLYYGMRNAAYYYSNRRKQNAFFFWINHSVYMLILLLFSIRHKKAKRYRLLCDAVCDGLAGRIGINVRFLL